LVGDQLQLAERLAVARVGGAQKILGLMAELVEVGMSRKCRHDVSFTA
jgi:hypothetical protein